MWALLGLAGQSSISRFVAYVLIGALGAVALVSGFTAWLAIHDAATAREARAGYVLLAEKTAAEAKAAELQRQASAASQALEEHRRRLDSAKATEQALADQLEQELSQHEKELDAAGRACRLDDADLDWLRRH